jgi:hypothetical protein
MSGIALKLAIFTAHAKSQNLPLLARAALVLWVLAFQANN